MRFWQLLKTHVFSSSKFRIYECSEFWHVWEWTRRVTEKLFWSRNPQKFNRIYKSLHSRAFLKRNKECKTGCTLIPEKFNLTLSGKPSKMSIFNSQRRLKKKKTASSTTTRNNRLTVNLNCNLYYSICPF